MANISKIKLPDGVTYNVTDTTSGYITSYTDEKLALSEVSNNTYYPIISTSSTSAETKNFDTTGFKYSVSNGTTGSTGVATIILGNNTAQGATGNKEGRIKLFGPSSGGAELYASTSTYMRMIKFPDKTGTIALTSDIPTVPSSTGSSTAGISVAAHSTDSIYGVSSSTTSVYGVSSSTTTASKVTVGSSSTDYGVTAAGSGSASLTFTMDTTDTKKLKITFSHTHTAPTLGSKVPTVSASDVTVPIKNADATTVPIKNSSATTVVTSATHSVTDNGHTHTI